MTFIGKLFVMVNVAVSLMLMVAGLGLFATRVDWTDAPAKGGAPAGVMSAKKAALKDVTETIRPAEATWSASYGELFVQEKNRATNRQFFSDRLADVRGDPDTGRQPQMAVLNAGLPVLDAIGQPKLAPATNRQGEPGLKSLKFYEGELVKKHAENEAELKRFNAEVTKDIALTDELIGKDGKKGLRDLINDEKVKREGLEAEIEQTGPLFINAKVEAAVSQRRIDLLDEQIKSLKERVRSLEKLDAEP